MPAQAMGPRADRLPLDRMPLDKMPIEKMPEGSIGDLIDDYLNPPPPPLIQTGLLSGRTETMGWEPFAFDGASLKLIGDINEGSASSMPSDFVMFNGDLYFKAFTEEAGYELYRVSGTDGATTLIDIYEGSASGLLPTKLSAISGKLFTQYNGDMYFAAVDELTGRGLYKIDSDTNDLSFIDGSDGLSLYAPTVAGETLYLASTDTNGFYSYSESGGLNPVSTGLTTLMSIQELTEFGGDLYFFASSSESTVPNQIHRLDGVTGAATPLVSDGGPASQAFKGGEVFYEFNGDLFFGGRNGLDHALFSVSGTDGTLTRHDIGTGVTFPPRDFTEFNGDLYFSVATEENGSEIGRLDGETGEYTLIDVRPGAESSNAFDFLVHDGELYFGAETAEHGYDLVRLDADGAFHFDDLAPGSTDSWAAPLGVVNGSLAVAADVDGDGVWELLASSDTGYHLVEYQGADFEPDYSMVVMNGDYLFV